MLHAPERQPPDPDFDPSRHPRIRPAEHMLFLPDVPEETMSEGGAILMGLAPQRDEEKLLQEAMDNPEYRNAVRIRAMLDHAAVKDAVTSLHREDDEQARKLAGYKGQEIGAILPDQERFVRAQEAKYAARFTDDRQRLLFQRMTKGYSAQAMNRARALRDRLVLDYRTEATERQNAEFLERALRPENVFDDAAQTAFRDMTLFNLDTLHADAPARERKEILERAAAAYYRRILERRLELNPARMRSMLDAPAVRRTLGEDAIRDLEERARTAMEDESLERTAREWAEAGHDPAAARRLASAGITDADKRAAALGHYGHWRHADNMRVILDRFDEADAAWERLADGGFSRAAIPAGARRNRPALYGFLLRLLDARERAGGRDPDPDCLLLASLATGFEPRRTCEALRDEEKCFDLLARLGGPKTDACRLAARLIAGRATAADQAFREDMLPAAAKAATMDGDADKAAFLACFVKNRRIAMARSGVAELNADEVRELLGRAAGDGAHARAGSTTP